jgi:hypothetical protein
MDLASTTASVAGGAEGIGGVLVNNAEGVEQP